MTWHGRVPYVVVALTVPYVLLMTVVARITVVRWNIGMKVKSASIVDDVAGRSMHYVGMRFGQGKK